MAKYEITYLIDPRYTPSNKRYPIEFNFYKAGMFEGIFNSSYYTVSFAGKELYKNYINKGDYIANQRTVWELILFIHSSMLDSITTEEVNYLRSNEYNLLSQYLHFTTVVEFNLNDFDPRFQADFKQIELSCRNKRNNFSINDIGRLLDIYDYNITQSSEIYDIENGGRKIDECFVGRVFVRKGDRTIRIPIIRPINGRIETKCKVDVKEFHANVDIFKCLMFQAKLNFLYNFLCRGISTYQAYFPPFWKNHFNVAAADSHEVFKTKQLDYFRII